jgi:uncharacterized protein with GYD domain
MDRATIVPSVCFSPETPLAATVECGDMRSYLLQATYSADSWAALVANPHDRTEAVRAAVQALGGTLTGIWLAFGDTDVVAVLQMPDEVAAAGVSMAISAGGAVTSVRTTPLLTLEEGVVAMRKASSSGYLPPSDDFWMR